MVEIDVTVYSLGYIHYLLPAFQNFLKNTLVFEWYNNTKYLVQESSLKCSLYGSYSELVN